MLNLELGEMDLICCFYSHNIIHLSNTNIRIFLTNVIFNLNSCRAVSTGACFASGPGSSVGIETGYGLDGGGSNPGGGEIFRTCPDRPWVPPILLYNEYRVFPGVKSGRGVTLTLHPF